MVGSYAAPLAAFTCPGPPGPIRTILGACPGFGRISGGPRSNSGSGSDMILTCGGDGRCAGEGIIAGSRPYGAVAQSVRAGDS
jgi:hypothetical protein